jgi:hypothetical protein
LQLQDPNEAVVDSDELEITIVHRETFAQWGAGFRPVVMLKRSRFVKTPDRLAS